MKRGLFVLIVLAGCRYGPIHDPTEGAIHLPRLGQTDQYGRADDARFVVDEDATTRAKTPGRYGPDIDALQRLAERSWASRERHEEVDGIEIKNVFADMRQAVGGATEPVQFHREVRNALCRLGDMHFRLQEKAAGARLMASGLEVDAVSSAFVVRGVDSRYEGVSRKPRKGDVVVKADGKAIAQWQKFNCLRPGSTPDQRELNSARMFSTQMRLPEEKVRPEKITLLRPGGGTYKLSLRWRTKPTGSTVDACVTGRKIDGKIGVLTIKTFACPDVGMFDRHLESAINEIGRVKDMVVDVRRNGGGDDAQALTAASRFLADAPAWMRFRHHKAGETVSAFSDQPYEPADVKRVKAKRVWLLTGPGCASTCETFAAVMSTAPHVTVVGGKTAGGMGNPKPQKLTHSGLVVTVPSTEYAIPGTQLLIEGHGIWPDIEVHATLDDVARGRDPVLEAVVRRVPK